MRIICPQCSFSRDMPEEKIPPQARLATCPKCKHKFRLWEEEEEEQASAPEYETQSREEEEEEQAPAPEEETQPREEAVQGDFVEQSPRSREDDIWSTLKTLGVEGDEPEEEYGPEDESGPEEEATEEAAPSQVPWENPGSHGFLGGLLSTIVQVMSAPIAFFRSMAVSGGLGMPLAFYLLLMELQVLAQHFWRTAGVVPQAQEGLFGQGLIEVGALSLLLFYPAIMAVSLFVLSGVYYACLVALQEETKGYESIVRVVSYSSAPAVLALVPGIGPLVGMVWQLVCTFLGLREVQETTSGRALFAIFMPFVLLLFLATLVMMLEGAGLV